MDSKEAARKREVRRATLKRAAQLRAEINWRHAQERIDHRIDVIEPALDEIKALAEGEKTLEITDGE